MNIIKTGLLTDESISILVGLRTGVQPEVEEDRYNIQRALELLVKSCTPKSETDGQPEAK